MSDIPNVKVGMLLRLTRDESHCVAKAVTSIQTYVVPPHPFGNGQDITENDTLLVLSLHEEGLDIHGSGWNEGNCVAKVLIGDRVRYTWIGHQDTHLPWWFEEVTSES